MKERKKDEMAKTRTTKKLNRRNSAGDYKIWTKEAMAVATASTTAAATATIDANNITTRVENSVEID